MLALQFGIFNKTSNFKKSGNYFVSTFVARTLSFPGSFLFPKLDRKKNMFSQSCMEM
jgi:hypothetical protein